MIQITRKEQQLLRELKAVMAAEQTDSLSSTQLMSIDPELDHVHELNEKGILVHSDETGDYTITKEQLQVLDDDPEVEQAWEGFRKVQGNGSMTDLYNNSNKEEVLKANRNLEKVLFEKGRLTHMVDKDHGHIWVTEDRIQYWKNRGWKESCPEAVPINLQA